MVEVRFAYDSPLEGDGFEPSVGTWAGQVYLGNTIGQGLKWTARIQIPENGNGIVEYPSLNCRGILIPQPARGTAQYLERIQSGKCPDNGILTIMQHGDKLTYYWFGENTNHSRMTASASLSRVPDQQQAKERIAASRPTVPTGTDPFAYCRDKRDTDIIEQDNPPKIILDTVAPAGEGTRVAWWICKGGQVYACNPHIDGRACLDENFMSGWTKVSSG